MIGALLAGGKGSRLGGRSKAAIEVAGRPLASYPAAALAAVCERIAFVAKPGSELPDLDGVERWDEPDEPRHPVVGIIHALEEAAGPVLVCAADMPYVTAEACQALLGRRGGRHGGSRRRRGRGSGAAAVRDLLPRRRSTACAPPSRTRA